MVVLTIQTEFVAVIDELLCDCCRGECCRVCLPVCSSGGLMWVASEHMLMLDPWACEGCGNCVTACPQGAVSLHPRRSG
jgi:MinD superfamily P-loop ATPase